LEAVAAQSGGYLLVNVDAAAPGGAIHKTAVLIGRDAILGSYEKMRLVPFGEYIPLRSALGWLSGVSKAAAVNRVRGSQVTVLREPGLPAFSPLICFESAFPDMSRTAARRGADVLLFQAATTTFQGSWAPDQHAGLAAVRAVESGRPALQATLSGTTAAFDAQGRRLLWHPAATGAAAVALPLAARTTPYDRWGDWVLAASVVIVVAACVGLSLGAARREFDGRPDPDEKPTTRHPEPPAQRSVAVTGRS
jgi:apolipoprotein N-acyltransferase